MNNQQHYIIIAGVFKAATTSLFSYLAMHPDICPSNVKETRYFTHVWKQSPPPPFEEYQSYFNDCPSGSYKYHLDASPGYFYGGQNVAKPILEYLGDDTKVILLLRDPVARFISHFRHEKKFLFLPQDVSMEEFIEAWQSGKNEKNFELFPIKAGLYDQYLEEWFDVFGDNLVVKFFDEMKSDREGLLRSLADWLDIDSNLFPFDQMYVENKTVAFSNRHLQTVALGINRAGSHFWNQHPEIKRNLKSIYYRFNSKDSDDSLTDEQREYISDLYHSSNQNIYKLLKSQGYHNLPSWLTED